MGKKSVKKKIPSNCGPITRSETLLNRIMYYYDPGESMIENEDILNRLAEKPRRIITRKIYSTLFKDNEVQELSEPDEGTSTELNDMSSIAKESESLVNLNDSSLHHVSSVSEISSQAKESESMMNLNNRSTYGFSNVSDISSQAQESESIMNLNNSSSYGFSSVSDISNQAKESDSMMNLNNSSAYGFRSVSDISSQDQEAKSIMNLNNSSAYDLGSLNSLTIPDGSCGSTVESNAPVQKEQVNLQPPETQGITHSKSELWNRWIENALDTLLPYIP
ncbi:hypothetical protein AVEN_175765-1 [Araneus ventricosus]|uniref:Uncharacterized protein n=1 Tax=Araneus ventricosus TaxID=182803 RepID=A0A4Y2GBY9_ARAVE|nr:hypothetical protein AVEN_175765-1 [Araneus ventricosus]